MNKTIKILRGIPGSGKSTLAKQLWAEHTTLGADVQTFSADFFFMRDGVYIFNYRKLDEAHNQCFRGFVKTVVADPPTTPYGDVWHGKQVILVDNTHTTVMEMSPYVRIAKAFDVPFEIVTVDCPVEIAAARGLHNVPLDRVTAMRKRLVDAQLPKEWPHRIVQTGGLK